jgi:hypothetical protein
MKLNPLEIYLDMVEYVRLEKTARRSRQKEYRKADYAIIRADMNIERILSFKSMMFNVHQSHKSHKRLQGRLDEIQVKIKR